MKHVMMRISYYLGKLRRYGIYMLFALVIIIICLEVFRREKGVEEPVVFWGLTTEKELPPTEPPTPAIWLVIFLTENSVCNHLAAELPGWTILIVGALKPPNYSHTRCHFLKKEPDDDPSLSHGYLYAIQHGAEYIYVPPRDVLPAELQIPRHVFTQYLFAGVEASQGNSNSNNSKLAGLDENQSLFDANAHFGCNVSYHLRSQNVSNYNYVLCEQQTPAIQTGVLLGPVSPVKVDRGHYLDQSAVHYYDKTAPAVTLKRGNFIKQALRGTLYKYEAFWALPFVTLDPSEESIYFMFVQKMLWLTGSNVLIYANGVTEKEAFYDNGRIKAVQLLSGISCQYEAFQGCADKLISPLVGSELLSKKLQKNKITLWLKTLQDVGYTFPTTYMTNAAICVRLRELSFHAWNTTGQIVTQENRKTPFFPVANSVVSSYLYQRACQGHRPVESVLASSSQVDLNRPWTQFNDILLIVIFNNPHYESIPYLEILYRSFFPSILYCGPGKPDVEKHPILKNYQFSFLSYGSTPTGHTPGAFNYKCTAMAVTMHYDVEGYLVIADDLLLIIHSIQNLPQHTIWFLPQREIRVGEITKLRECRLGMCDFFGHWNWWEAYQKPAISVMKYLRDRKQSTPLIHRCQQEIARLNGADIRPNGAFSDIYYVPRRKAQDFQKLSKIFLDHDVFLEIAVPTILRCLETPEDVQPLHGIQNWFETRNKPWNFFTAKDLVHKAYIHPVKWGYITKGSEDFLDFFCKQIVPFSHDRYARLNSLS